MKKYTNYNKQPTSRVSDEKDFIGSTLNTSVGELQVTPVNVRKIEVTEAEPAKVTPLTGVIHNCTFVNVRREPSKASEVLEVLRRGDGVDIVSIETRPVGWTCIRKGLQYVGYIMSNYVKVGESDE